MPLLLLSLLLGASPPEHLIELTPAQAEQVDDEGFAVLNDHSAWSFPQVYSRIYDQDLPVFITADSLLHAQHRSFDRVLEELETQRLIGAFDALLKALHEDAPAGDLDLHLAVARSLLTDASVDPRHEDDTRLKAALANATLLQPAEMTLFGVPQVVDLSMLKPRGHYTNSRELSRYFAAMMWLSVTPLRVSETLPNGKMRVNREALEASVTLAELCQRGEAKRQLAVIEGVLGRIMGEQDNATVEDIVAFARAVPQWKTLDDEALLAAVQGQLGATTRIRGAVLHDDTVREGLPVDVMLLGQRWVFDGELLSAVTHPSVERRMMPSGLDVMAGLGSSTARDLQAKERRKFDYDAVLDSFAAEPLVPDDLYHAWLATIAALDDPVEAELPAPMLTSGWRHRVLEAQLASWSELRRDTILYAQHSFSASISCEFPHAYVEPAPAFFEALLTYDALMIELAEYSESAELVRWAARVAELHGELQGVVEAQLTGQKLSRAQTNFLRQTIEKEMVGCGEVVFDGWYPELFWRSFDVDDMTPTIADVHTAPTDEYGNPVGEVLHVATDYPRTLVVIIDDVAYYGPVSTWTELTTTGFLRLRDGEWAKRRKETPRPEWTQTYAP